MSMSSEPGREERQVFADACARVEIARKKLGQSYCHLVLGIGLNDLHHMGCGRSACLPCCEIPTNSCHIDSVCVYYSKRVSETLRDRSLYEVDHPL